MSAEAKENKNPWIGPYECLNSNGVIVQLDVKGNPTWVHRHHVILCKSRPAELDPELSEQFQYSGEETEKPQRSSIFCIFVDINKRPQFLSSSGLVENNSAATTR
jgi:hypothetical protein